MEHKISHDSETPATGQQVITACAFIHKDFEGVQKVLMPRRAKTKKFMPDIYELPGGHIDFGEDPIEGLKREVEEELHVRISVGDPFYVFTYSNPVKGSHSIQVIYFAELLDPIENIQIHPADHSEIRWFAESEWKDMLSDGKPETDPEIIAIKKAFALLRGERLNFK